MRPAFEELRVAIVGAGPAGLSMAWHLRTLGLRNVELFDAAAEIGGQSVTVNVGGISVDLGTCYLNDGYFITRDIAKRLGCPVERLPKATWLDEAGKPTTRAPLDTGLLARYLARWMGWHLAGQMRRPTNPENSLPFRVWLEQNGFAELASEFNFSAGLTAQLYGPLDVITTHSGLTWMRPSRFSTGRFQRAARISVGFQTFWRRMAENLGYPIRLRTPIDAVHPVSEHPSQVELFDGARRIGEPFDQVVVTCPLDRLEHPLSATLREHDPFDTSSVYSGVWQARGWPSFVPSRCYLPHCISGERGRLLSLRRDGTADGWSAGQLCAYGVEGQSVEAHRERVLREARDIVGLKDIEMVTDRLWRYNVRYSAGQLRKGLPAVLERAQGQQSTWYSGGALSHWNVESIMGFNHTLAGRFAEQLGAPLKTKLKLWRWDPVVRDL